jgi:hypothetical protein
VDSLYLYPDFLAQMTHSRLEREELWMQKWKERKSDSESEDEGHRNIKRPHHRRRVVLFIVDALRYDFVTNNPEMKLECTKHSEEDLLMRLRSESEFESGSAPSNAHTLTSHLRCSSYNNFPLLNELLGPPSTRSTSASAGSSSTGSSAEGKEARERGKAARLYKAYADPPTTTSQRLKAIITGSLPTFIELGANFESSLVTEDNIISQLKAHPGSKVAVIGDDTWTNLFNATAQFDFSAPYDSFNTKDLDTVDDGVERTLLDLFKGLPDPKYSLNVTSNNKL